MKLIGRRFFLEVKENINPPLWMWIRLLVYFSISAMLLYFGLIDFARILLVLAIASFLGGILATICKAVANAIKRIL